MKTLQCISFAILGTIFFICFLALINYFDEIKNYIKMKESFIDKNNCERCKEVIKDYTSKNWGFDSVNDFIDCNGCPRVTHLTESNFDYSTFNNNDDVNSEMSDDVNDYMNDDITAENNYLVKIVNLKKQINTSLINGTDLPTILNESHYYYNDLQSNLTPPDIQLKPVQNLNHWILEYISSHSRLREYIQTIHMKYESLRQDSVLATLKMYTNAYKNQEDIIQIWEDIYDELDFPKTASNQRRKKIRKRPSTKSTDSFYETKFNNLTALNIIEQAERERVRKLRQENTFNLMLNDRKHREYINSKRNIAV